MVNKIMYESEVNFRFGLISSDIKKVERLIKKVSKVLNKEGVGIDISINTTCEIYDINDLDKEKIKAYSEQNFEDEADLCDEDLLNELED